MKSTVNSLTLTQITTSLQEWQAVLDDLTDTASDPAYEFRLSSANEALRYLVDAIVAQPNFLTSGFIVDLVVLMERLADDMAGPSLDVDYYYENKDLQEQERKVGACAVCIRAIVDCLRQILAMLPTPGPKDVVPVDARESGYIEREVMMHWSDKAITALHGVERILLGDSFNDKSSVPFHRDAHALCVKVAIAAFGFSDCTLLEFSRLNRRLGQAETALHRVRGYLASRASLEPEMMSVCLEADAVFLKVATALVEGKEILQKSKCTDRSNAYVLIWRLLSKGRVMFDDKAITELVESFARNPMPTILDHAGYMSGNIDDLFAGLKGIQGGSHKWRQVSKLGEMACMIRSQWAA